MNVVRMINSRGDEMGITYSMRGKNTKFRSWELKGRPTLVKRLKRRWGGEKLAV
jgi:hypothetical protein